MLSKVTNCNIILSLPFRPADAPRPSVKQRIQLFEEDEEEGVDILKHQRQRPTSKAFELFETQGIIIGPVSTYAKKLQLRDQFFVKLKDFPHVLRHPEIKFG